MRAFAQLRLFQFRSSGQVGADMARNSGLDLVEDRDRRADPPGGAVAALIPVMLDECGLHGVHLLGRGGTLDRGHVLALVHDGEREAAVIRRPSMITVQAPH